ncbi:MAG: two-component regulator propeller domain-containing protein [Bacteroidota bacterium]
MRFYLLVLAALAMLVGASGSRAQPVFERITRADGLPSNYVLAVYQDRWGFVWFGTDAGAVRWDGTRAQTFSTDDGLPHSYVQGFAETADGTLWAATNAGVARRTETGWELVDSPAGRAPVSKILSDSEGRLVIAQADWIGRREETGWRALRRADGLGSRRAPLLDIGDGRLLVSGFRQPEVLVLSPEGDSFRADVVPIVGLDARPDALVAVYQTEAGLFALQSSRSGVGSARLASLRLDLTQRRLLAGAPVVVQGGAGDLVSHDGALYRANNGGLRRIDPVTGETGPRLISFSVRTSAVDREGGLWIGTFGQGAARLASTHLTALTDIPARRIAISGDEAWTFGGKGATLVRLAGGKAETWSLRRTGTARSGVVMPDGRFRVAGQAFLFEPLTTADLLQRIPPSNALPPAVEDGNWVSGSAETADSLWVGSYGSGLRRFRKTPSGLVEIDSISVADGLPTEAVEDVIRTSAGTWAVTRRGLALALGGRARAMGVADGLPSSAVFALFEARDGTHWAGTDRGLARLNLAEWTAEAVGVSAMAGRPVVAFFERRGVLHAVTTRSLWRVEPGSDGWSAHLVDGFPLTRDARQTVEHAAYHAPSDRLVLATSTGPVLADLASMGATPLPPPPIALVSASVDDEAVALVGSPREARLADLAPGRHRVTIQAAVLRFGGGGRVEWRMRDGKWAEADDGRVVLSDVRAGDHEIEIRAVDSGGEASEETALVSVRVAPHWWERGAVRALFVLVGLGALVVGVRVVSQRRLRARIRELETAERVRAERERISRDLHDHVGAEVAAILTRAEVGRLRAASEGRPADDLREVEDRARRTMGSLREAIWALGEGALTPGMLADRLGGFARDQAAPLELTVEARAIGETDQALAPAQALALYRIGQEAVRNAVCHSGGRRVAVTVEASRGRVAVIVRDDGIFGGSSGDGGGFGLTNMRARAEALGGTLSLSNGDGTTVRAEIPLAG